MKKIITLLLSMLIISSMLTSALAVEINMDSLYPIVDEPVEMTMLMLKSGASGDPTELWFWKYAEEKTNVKWNIIEVDSSIWGDKKSIMMATGDYPDVFWGAEFTNTEMMRYGSEGIFIPLNDLIDQYGDQIQNLFDITPGSREMITCPDGNIYSLPLFQLGTTFSDYRAWINSKWLDNLGLEMPTTLDEFYDVLVAFKEQDANGNGDPDDEIPWSGSWSDGLSGRWVIQYALGLMTAEGQNIAVKDGEANFLPLMDEYRTYLEFANRCWNAGLLDEECFTQTRAQFLLKGNEMRVGFAGSFSPHDLVGYDPNNISQYEHVVPLVEKEGQTPMWLKSSPVSIGMMEITDACQYPEVALRWMNMFYNPDEAIWLHNGPIYGSEYDYDGTGWIPESGTTEPKGLTEANPDNLGWWDYLCAYMVPRNRGTNWMVTIDDVYALDMAESIEFNRVWSFEEDWWRTQNVEKTSAYFTEGYPSVVFYTEEQTERLNELLTPLDTYVDQMEAKFITGVESFDNYDQFIETLIKMGAEEVNEIYRGAYAK